MPQTRFDILQNAFIDALFEHVYSINDDVCHCFHRLILFFCTPFVYQFRTIFLSRFVDIATSVLFDSEFLYDDFGRRRASSANDALLTEIHVSELIHSDK